ATHLDRPSFPTRRSSDLRIRIAVRIHMGDRLHTCAAHRSALVKLDRFSRRAIFGQSHPPGFPNCVRPLAEDDTNCLWNYDLSFRSEEHTSELQSRENLVC